MWRGFRRGWWGGLGGFEGGGKWGGGYSLRMSARRSVNAVGVLGVGIVRSELWRWSVKG